MNNHHLMLMCVLAVVAGIAGLVAADRLRFPSIIFLLLFGIALGPDGAGIILPSMMGRGLEVLVKIAVSIILFEGALTLRARDVAGVFTGVRRLVTFGVGITWAGATLAAWGIAGLPGHLAALFGALVTVTGPTVIRPLLDRVPVKRNVGTVLRSEGVLADPIGVFIAVLVLELILSFGANWRETLVNYIGRLGIGAAIGAAGGFVLPWVLRSRWLIAEQLQNLTGLAGVLGIFAVSEFVMPESGLAAVVSAGLAAPRRVMPQEYRLRLFKEELTLLFISVLFILLAANVRIESILREGWRGVVVALALMAIVRPLCAFFSLDSRVFSFRERLFVAAIAPRGVVAASAASLFALVLEEKGFAGGSRVEALVFLTIALTVVIQGLLARPTAWALGLLSEEDRAVIVVGANAVGRSIADVYRRAGRPVLVTDTNPILCKKAKEEGLAIECGNVFDRAYQDRINIHDAGTLIAVTPNSEVNVLTAQMAREDYRVPHVYMSIDHPEKGAGLEHIERVGGHLAFGRPLSLTPWLERLKAGEAVIILREIPSGESGTLPQTTREFEGRDDAVPLLVVHGDRIHACDRGTRWGPGDKVLFLARHGTFPAATDTT